jgi:cell division septation protein DedD
MRQRLGDYEEQDNFLGVVGDDRSVGLSEQRRLLPTALITVTAMAVFAGGLWFAYVEGARHGAAPQTAATGENVPLIRADQRPTKVKPDQPGGMDVPDRDKLVFSERAGGPQVERLLPPPERPEPLPVPVPKQALVTPPPVPAAPVLPIARTPMTETMPAAKAPSELAPSMKAAATLKPTEAKPVSAVKPAAATAASASAVAPGGGVRVQLGSLRSPETARDEWQRLKRVNSDLLGKLTAVAVRAEVPDKGTYYRVEAGPLADGPAASQLCAELKKRNLGCTIVR